MLNAPEFLYFVEHGDQPVDGPVRRVPAESRTSSRAASPTSSGKPRPTTSSPARGDGSLLEAETYEAQVLRLIEDPRAPQALDEFYEDWMKVEDLAVLDAKANDPLYQAFAGADMPGPDLRRNMIEDVVGLLDYLRGASPPRSASSSPRRRASRRSQDLATIYGVDPWDGVSEPPALPEGQRPGLLTRALFLSTGSANTRPIMKGVFIRKHRACATSIDPPPAGANATPPELTPGHDHARSGGRADRRRGQRLRGLPHDADQPARVRDRELRLARPLPHRAAALRRGRRIDRLEGRSTPRSVPASTRTTTPRRSARPAS